MQLKQKSIKATTSKTNCKVIWIVPAILTTDNQNINADGSSCIRDTFENMEEKTREQMQSCPVQPAGKVELMTSSVLECHRFK